MPAFSSPMTSSRARWGVLLRGGLLVALFLALLPLVSGCGVPRRAAVTAESIDLSTLSNLRRAQAELREQITREREHVAAFHLRVSELRLQEARLHELMLAAESDYQLRQADLSGVEVDLALVRAEIAEADGALALARAELDLKQQELEALVAQSRLLLEALADLRLLVERGQVALGTLAPEVIALLEELRAAEAAEAAAAAAKAAEAAEEPGSVPAPAPEPTPEPASEPEPAPEPEPEPEPEPAPEPAPAPTLSGPSPK